MKASSICMLNIFMTVKNETLRCKLHKKAVEFRMTKTSKNSFFAVFVPYTDKIDMKRLMLKF